MRASQCRNALIDKENTDIRQLLIDFVSNNDKLTRSMIFTRQLTEILSFDLMYYSELIDCLKHNLVSYINEKNGIFCWKNCRDCNKSNNYANLNNFSNSAIY